MSRARRRSVLAAALVASLAGGTPVLATPGPEGQVCSLDGSIRSTGGGRGGYSYSLEGSGSCRQPLSTVTLTSTDGGGDIFWRLPTCLRQLGGPPDLEPALANGSDHLRVLMTVRSRAGGRTLATDWQLRNAATYVAQTALVYRVTGELTGRAVVTGRDESTCVYGHAIDEPAPVTIELELGV